MGIPAKLVFLGGHVVIDETGEEWDVIVSVRQDAVAVERVIAPGRFACAIYSDRAGESTGDLQEVEEGFAFHLTSGGVSDLTIDFTFVASRAHGWGLPFTDPPRSC